MCCSTALTGLSETLSSGVAAHGSLGAQWRAYCPPGGAGCDCCARGTEPGAAVDLDIALVDEYGIVGVPGVAVDGVLLGAPPNSLVLMAMIRERLRNGARGVGLESPREPSSGTIRLAERQDHLPAGQWFVSSTPDLSIGSADGPEEYALLNVADAAVLSDGTVVIAQFLRRFFEMRYFGPDGVHRTTVGRYGEGPFEFRSPVYAIGRLPGDSLLLASQGQRFAAFGPAGERVRTGRVELPIGAFPWGLVDPEHLVAITFDTPGLGPGAEARGTTRVWTYELAGGSPAREVAPMGAGRAALSPDGAILHFPFDVEGHWTAGGGRVWFASSDQSTIHAVTPSGAPAGTIHLDWSRARVTRDLAERWRACDLRGAPERLRRAREAHNRGLSFPDSLPLVQSLQMDLGGNVWVLRYEPPWSTAEYVWTVFGSDGGHVADVRAPFDVSGLVFSKDSRTPVPGAVVWVVGEHPMPKDSAVADRLGRFTIRVGAPSFIVARHPAYLTSAPVRVDPASHAERPVMIELTPWPGAGDGVAVGPSDSERMGRVRGTIVSRRTGEPLEGATVEVVELRRTVGTRWDGRFDAGDVGPGPYQVRVSLFGYGVRTYALEVEPGLAYDLRVPLDEEAIPLEGVTVTVRPRVVAQKLEPVFERMRRGLGGHFLDREVLDRRGYVSLAQVLEGLPSVELGGSRFRPVVTFRRGFSPGGRRHCSPVIFVDGQRAGVGETASEFLAMYAADLEVVEVYPGMTGMPPEFGADVYCAIGIWTGRGG